MEDDPPRSDAGEVVPPDASGMTSVDAGPAVCQARGTITYDRRPISITGLGEAAPDDLVGVTVVLLIGDVATATTHSGEGGAYCFPTVPTGTVYDIRVVAEDMADFPLQVVDHEAAVYAVRAGPFMANGEPAAVHVSEADNAGAFALFDTMREGLVFTRTTLARTLMLPDLRVRWERGNTTPGGTSYWNGTDIWMLGGPTDTDEFDSAVVLHELGHYIDAAMGPDADGSGMVRDGANTGPVIALSEGWATHFANLVAGTPNYIDSEGDGLYVAYDLANLPFTDNFVAQIDQGMDQTHHEMLVAASLWELSRADDSSVQDGRMLSVFVDWLGGSFPDRAAVGADLADFLDGYLCLFDDLHRSVISDYVVGQRFYPYDFGATCPAGKPGRHIRCSGGEPRAYAARSTPPGHIILDGAGRQLREVRL